MPPLGKLRPLAAGQRVADRYVLRAALGRGSMAEVWSADDERTNTAVALKVIAELLALNEHAQKRFAREVQAIHRIAHPYIVSLLGHGMLDDGRAFLVMELVHGQSLAQFLGTHRQLSGLATVRLGCQIAEGLCAAHDCGIVHRDMKPANILLAEHGDGRKQVKIVDFGVARMVDDFAEPDARLTRTGTMLGSPRYMPLEVARGASDVDARCDIFGVGAVLYHCLVGQPPFRGLALGELMRQIASHDVPSLGSERPDLSPELVGVIEWAMAHLPEDRPANTRLLLDALLALAG